MDYRPIYLKNTTSSLVTLTGLGLTIAANDTTEVDWEDVDRLMDDADLRSLISSGTLVVNNGTSNLSAADAFAYIDPWSNLSSNYFTAAQLSAGQLDTRYYNKTQID